MEAILGWLGDNVFGVAISGGVGGLGLLISWILKKYFDEDALNKRLDKWLEDHTYIIEQPVTTVGKWTTQQAVNLPIIGPIWNNVIEPLLIFGIDVVWKILVWIVTTAATALKKALMSDNPNFAGQSKAHAAKANKPAEKK